VVGRFKDRTHTDVRLDDGTLDLPRVFDNLARLDFQGAIIPEHFPEFPCTDGLPVSCAFALGYSHALIQACRTGPIDQQGSCP